MSCCITRRKLLSLAGTTLGAGVFLPNLWIRAQSPGPNSAGAVVGEPTAAKVGGEILARGGNAVDAAVAAALAAGVAAPHQCGPGGYGGHMTIAMAGKKVTSIDFNSRAPAAMREDTGLVNGRLNPHGWLAAGVPGTMAGLQLALDRFGTLDFRAIAGPAIRIADEGIRVSNRNWKAFMEELGVVSASSAGELFRNPELAEMLRTLADRNSVDSFYRGDIAGQIAAAFQKHDGLVTKRDLAQYRAREVAPLVLEWRGHEIFTAPLTAGGLTVLEALSVLKALKWQERRAGAGRTHAYLETLRLAWNDRLNLLGDPEHAEVPVERLLSQAYARELADRVNRAVEQGKPVSATGTARGDDGTVHLSAGDRHGNLAALTLTHGNAFGARVIIDGLGLVLGHGMSRFHAGTGHPNSPGPGKRPLHNMCPTIVKRDGQPLLALGGAGGRRIPNALIAVLSRFVGLGATARQAVAAPRMHSEGNMDVRVDAQWPVGEVDSLRAPGYRVSRASVAKASAVFFDADTKACLPLSR
jgi:gamma-glutamyltranspeptidase/glutathione hydrolase